ncbi:MAG: hypothetical protein Kow0010_14150 [Dehalococcoidia bacterium]
MAGPRPVASTMNWVSILILALLGLLTWRAYRNGFVRELVSLAAVVLAVPVAGLLYDDMVPKVDPIVDNLLLSSLVSFLAIFGGIIIAGQVAAHLLRRSVEVLNLGAADQLAGGAFGLLKGIILCQVLLIALVMFPDPDLRDDIDDSRIARTMLDGTPFVLSILPQRFNEGIDAFLEGVDRIEQAFRGGPAPADP